jgi:hypothetical protein
VLRDRDGVRVQALVEPRCGASDGAESFDRCAPLEFDSPNMFPCVRVIDHEGRFINLQYDLTTGELGPCIYSPGNLPENFSKPWTEHLGVPFLNAQCDGAPYFPTYDGVWYGAPQFTRSRHPTFAENDVWFPAEEGCIFAQFWMLDVGLVCDGPQSGYRLCPFKRVPEWVKTLLPNPPYTLAVEYE